jgi:hypothetical protein
VGLLNKSLFVVILCCTLFATWLVTHWGIADYYARQSEVIVASWSADATAGTDESIREVIALDKKALSYAPNHRTYLMRLGEMHGLLYRRNRLQYAAYGELAADYLRASIAVRPHWPHTWAELAVMKVALQQVDRELEQAIRMATRHGPWEPVVHRRLVSGFEVYRSLPGTSQSLLLGNLQRGLLSPDRGAAQTVADLIKASAGGLDLYGVRSLGDYMIAISWPDHSLVPLTDVTLHLWRVFSAKQRLDLQAKLTEAVVLDKGSQVLNRLRTARKLALVCPYLARQPRVTRYCQPRDYIRSLRIPANVNT